MAICIHLHLLHHQSLPSTIPIYQSKLHSSISSQNITFLNYTSSEWELKWIKRITELGGVKIQRNGHTDRSLLCPLVGKDSDLIWRFFNASCTSFPTSESSKWCCVDDSYRPIYVDRSTGHLYESAPPGVVFGSPRPAAVLRDHKTYQDLYSRFYYRNEDTGSVYYEYIEPLVAMLRNPLNCCEHHYKHGVSFSRELPNDLKCKGGLILSTFRGQFLPPPSRNNSSRSFYFDAGASDWVAGAGGPSLSYFHQVWNRHGISFDQIHAYEATTPSESFYASVPQEKRSSVYYRQAYVRSSAGGSTDQPFIPHEILQMTSKEDYVLFKLDIDSPGVEEGNVDFLLSNQDGILEYIDEFFYEFHLDKRSAVGLVEWYFNFLKLRRAGVRAHSWI